MVSWPSLLIIVPDSSVWFVIGSNSWNNLNFSSNLFKHNRSSQTKKFFNFRHQRILRRTLSTFVELLLNEWNNHNLFETREPSALKLASFRAGLVRNGQGCGWSSWDFDIKNLQKEEVFTTTSREDSFKEDGHMRKSCRWSGMDRSSQVTRNIYRRAYDPGYCEWLDTTYISSCEDCTLQFLHLKQTLLIAQLFEFTSQLFDLWFIIC